MEQKTKYGYWTVDFDVKPVFNNSGNRSVFCTCICGIQRYVNFYRIRSGSSRSCGCRSLELRFNTIEINNYLHTRKHGKINLFVPLKEPPELPEEPKLKTPHKGVLLSNIWLLEKIVTEKELSWGMLRKYTSRMNYLTRRLKRI